MATPKAIAEAFLQTYVAAFASGDAATVAGMYAADSTLVLDGQIAEGAETIAAGVIAPRFQGGGITLHVSSYDALLLKATAAHIAILVTGEASANPPGRFSQLIILAATAEGGFYIKTDISRFGAGGEFTDKDALGLGKQFLDQYYAVYASNDRSALAGFYNDNSQVICEGDEYEGVGQTARSILVKLAAPEGTKPLPVGAHGMESLDSVALVPADAPVGGVTYAVACLVTGKIQLEGEANKLAFAQAFIVVIEGETPSCSCDLLRFNYA